MTGVAFPKRLKNPQPPPSINDASVAHICKEGVDAICSIVNELEVQGYVTRSRSRDEKGRLGAMEYVIHEQPKDIKNDPPKEKKPKREYPVLDKPVLEKPEQGEPEQEDPAQLNIDINNTFSNTQP